MRVYGPYQRKDGRLHIVEIDDNGKRRTVSYPKWLMENHLGRRLLDNETVDHIDNDYSNNELSNLQILDRSVHAALDAKRIRLINVACSWCKQVFMLSRGQMGSRRNKKSGRFCSRKCSGLYGKHIQNGGTPYDIPEIQKEYYTLKQELGNRKVINGDDDIGESFDNGNSEGTQ